MMVKILLAVAVGLVAGAIDIIPMVRQKIHKASIQCVFTQWVFIGLIIPFVDWEIQPWLKGLILAELGMIALMLLAYGRAQKSPIPIIISSAFLGIGIAVLNDLLI